MMVRILIFLTALTSVSCISMNRRGHCSSFGGHKLNKDHSACCGKAKLIPNTKEGHGPSALGAQPPSVKKSERRLHSVADAKGTAVSAKPLGPRREETPSVQKTVKQSRSALSKKAPVAVKPLNSNARPADGSSAESSESSEKKVGVLNRVIEDLNFSPVNGPGFRLSDLRDMKAVVIAMRERDCPISEKYSPRLRRLEKEFAAKGVRFIFNYVGQVRPKKDGAADLKDHGFKGAYVIDSKQTVVQALSAKTTGDVFILTPERKVIYRGPVDDQYHLLKSALKPKNNYVADILSAMAAGKKVTPKELPAPGCLISRPLPETKS